jgi:hypothetical protein
MIPELPVLAIVPTDKLILHEHHDRSRAIPLIESLKSTGVLRNPPIVTALQDRTNRFVVLDGANRSTALQEMGFEHVLVQVVLMDDPKLELRTWNHIVWELDSESLLKDIEGIPQVSLQPTSTDTGYRDLMNGQTLILINLSGEESYSARLHATKLIARVDALNNIVDVYLHKAKMDRTSLRNVNALKAIYPQLSGLLVFPPFSVDEIAHLAGSGHLLPSGITRFTISPRVLHINYPLEELSVDRSLKIKNHRLDHFIQRRMANKKLRYYAEATFIFDE